MQAIACWSTLILVALATIWDLRVRRIPNWLVLPFLAGGLVSSTIFRGWSGLSNACVGALIGGLIMGIFYFLGGMGMGDVKLCAAVGAWIGPTQLLSALIFMGLTGGVIALIWALCGGFLNDSLASTGDLLAGFQKNGLRPHPTLVLHNKNSRTIPYAPAIAIGTLLSFLAVK